MSNVSAAIDALVASSAAGSTTVSAPAPATAGPQPATGGRPHASLRVTVGDPEGPQVQVLQEAPSAQLSNEPARIHDSGQDIDQSVAAINKQLSSLEQRLAEVQYDLRTGEAAYKVQGQARAALEAQFARARASAAFDLGQLQGLKAQRAADAARPAAQPTLAQAAAREQFLGTGPDRAQRAKVWDEEVARQQAALAVAAALK